MPIILVGCSTDSPQKRNVADTAYAEPARVEPSAGSTHAHTALPDSTAAPRIVPILRDVRVAAHADHDRVVFQFEGPVPEYRVAFTEQITECGSGNGVDLPGNSWLSVRFSPANAHTEAGSASGAPRALPGVGPNVQALKQVCDFEAVVEWVVALDHAGQFDVLELTNPSRIAIDIKH